MKMKYLFFISLCLLIFNFYTYKTNAYCQEVASCIDMSGPYLKPYGEFECNSRGFSRVVETICQAECGSSVNSCIDSQLIDVADSSSSYLWKCTADYGTVNCNYPKPSSVNGGWSSRSRGSRGSCNASTGTQSRSGTRSCTNPSPSNGGSYCSGSSSTTQTQNCRVNGGWSSRSYGSRGSCNTSTGIQTRTLSRSCTDPSPKNGGSYCSGSSSLTQSQNCRVNGGWSSRSRGSWGSCNASTGTQSRTGTRSCTNPSPSNGGSYCSGSSSTTQTQNCRVDGGWSSWSYGSWGYCNSSTGTQSRTLSRTCDNPTPKNGGSYCSGSSTDYQTQNCRVDGGWSSRSWGSWGSCDVTTGYKWRTGYRWCDNPTPKNGGWYCSGSSSTLDNTTCLVNATCGSGNDTCSAGSYIDTTDSGGYSRWQCRGFNGGSSQYCSYRTDYTPPNAVVEYSTTDWTNGSVTVTIQCSDIGGAGCEYQNYTKIVTQNESGHITISDTLGNTRNIDYVVSNIDSDIPTGSISYGNDWYSTAQNISISAQDTGGSTLKQIILQKNENDSGYENIHTYGNISSNTFSQTYSQSAKNEANMKFRMVVIDVAGNQIIVTSPKIMKFDTQAPGVPIITSSTHNDGVWSNKTTVNFGITDQNAGPSPWKNYYCFDQNNTCNPSSEGNTKNYSNLADGSHYFRAKTCDVGGCSDISSFEVKIDTVIPEYDDISSISPGNNSDILAIDSRLFEIEVSNKGGSPISLIEGYFENYNSKDSLETTVNTSNNDLYPGDTAKLSVMKNVSNVDQDRDSDGSRQYRFRVTKVVDEAGNIFEDTTNGVKDFTYNVFANSQKVVSGILKNELIINKVADATNAEFTIELTDEYGNKIIPATGINRQISFEFSVNNNLKSNQYSINTSDAITLDRPRERNNFQNRFSSSSVRFNNEPSVDGKYTYNFQIYAPTYDANAKDGKQWVNADATINKVNYYITQNPTLGNETGEVQGANGIEFKFKPLFKAEFIGDLSNKIIGNGTIQKAHLKVVKQSNEPVSQDEIYLGFGQTNGSSNMAHPNYSFTYDPNTTNREIVEGNQSDVRDLYSLGKIETKKFDTKIDLESGSVDTEQATYVSSHIKYVLKGKTVVYDAHTINKNRYVEGTNGVNTKLVGLKVLGKIQSKNQRDITTGQSGTDLYALGNNTKADLKEQIKKNVANITKNIGQVVNSGNILDLTGNSWKQSQSGTKLLNDSVLYFSELSGGNITIGNGTNLVASGIKTIIVEGGNVYIRSNISYGSDAKDMLGIIVLGDENNQGGNIYIHPSVTQLSATIYADKSMINYDGTQEIGGSSTETSQLKNQLYVFGTLFTENTIGGSVNPLICPYYIGQGDCDYNTAKKFDLNYMRRYFIQDDGTAYDGGKSYYSFGDNYYDYPMVIEYNPNVQSNPPPLFEM